MNETEPTFKNPFHGRGPEIREALRKKREEIIQLYKNNPSIARQVLEIAERIKREEAGEADEPKMVDLRSGE